jgi:hypothetical protein
MAGALPEGGDPLQDKLYLTEGSSLLEVNPRTAKVRATAPSADLYAVRNGVALGLESGADGNAWGLGVSAQRVAMTASGIGWPHYFVDLSGVGGSADPSSDLVVIAACAQAGPAVPATPAATADASPTTSTSTGSSTSPATSISQTATATPTAAATQSCLRPELLGLAL